MIVGGPLQQQDRDTRYQEESDDAFPLTATHSLSWMTTTRSLLELATVEDERRARWR